MVMESAPSSAMAWLPHWDRPSQVTVVPLQNLAARGSTNPMRRM